MSLIRSIIMAPVLAVGLAVCVTGVASASPMVLSATDAALGDAALRVGPDRRAVKAAHKTPRRVKAKKRNRRHHKRLHKRYRKNKAHKRAYRRSHKRYRRRNRSTGVTIQIYPRYSPYRYNPYYYDPYYVAPYYAYPRTRHVRLSCARVRNLLRRRGYRSIRAYDCHGKTYKYYVRLRGHRYKVRASAFTGQVRSRKRY